MATVANGAVWLSIGVRPILS